MRVGTNPAKLNPDLDNKYLHRIIVPVYIPRLDGYFRDSLKILDLCLESLFSTVNRKYTTITVINNGSCQEVIDYLMQKFGQNLINCLIHHTNNLGKIDAIMSVVKGANEPLITLSDADVLFLNGWQEAVEKIFIHFPNAGMVSPVPGARAYSAFTSSTVVYGLLNNCLKFENICDPNALKMFAMSIGNEYFYDQQHLNYQLIIKKGEFKAVVGCGHFVVTMRRQAFTYSPSEPSLKKLSGSSIMNYIDIPNDRAGLLRLATVSNYAYHLGNTWEDWMSQKFDDERKLKFENNSENMPNIKLKIKINRTFYTTKRALVQIAIKNLYVRAILFRYWGLPKEYINSY